MKRYRELGLADFSMLHGIDKQHPHGGIVVTEMMDAIDAALMRTAIDKALKRFPYWSVSLHKGISDVWFEQNTAEVALIEGTTKIDLGSAESNGHLFAFSYHQNQLLLHFSHILLDGHGIVMLLRTVIIYYCQLRYDPRLINPDALTADVPMDAEELCDPLLAKIPQGLPHQSPAKIPKAFRPDWAGQFEATGQYAWHIRIGSSKVNELCERYKVTPTVLIDVLFARAIHQMNEQQASPIISGMPASVRKLTGCQKSMLNASIPLRIIHHEAFWQLSFEQQLSAVSQQIKSQTDPSIMWSTLQSLTKLFRMLRLMPDVLRRFIMPRAFVKQVAINSYELSFSGRMRLNDTEKYVKGIYLEAAFKGSGMMMEMLALEKAFCISYVQEWEDSVYLDRLLNEMKEVGLNYQISDMSKK